jgi:hypothetical protein
VKRPADPIKVVIVGKPSAASDRAVARWLERFLAEERPGTVWRVVARRPTESRHDG